MKNLYPNIAYFTIKQPFLNVKIGDQVIISNVDGRNCLIVDEIELPIDMALKCPEWFNPITETEHAKLFEENSIDFLMSKGKSKEEAIKLFNNFLND